ncbi:hypothetical protein AGMMS50230_07720 [Spirochaetia bacterium]|nr:hypothetical protein AGMMS50230_07720 [Spirochaetia bacterium]
MNIKDVKEWLIIADDDFDSANILNAAVRKHNEIICYLCAQAVEKYLKGYLIYNNIVPERNGKRCKIGQLHITPAIYIIMRLTNRHQKHIHHS